MPTHPRPLLSYFSVLEELTGQRGEGDLGDSVGDGHTSPGADHLCCMTLLRTLTLKGMLKVKHP